MITSHGSNTALGEQQADAIIAMLMGGQTLTQVCALGVRAGWSRARVLDVLRARGLQLDAAGHPLHRPAPSDAGLEQLLAAGRRHDDERIAALASHIRGDLGTLRALLAADHDRQEAARRLVAADVRQQKLHAEHTATHPPRAGAR